ncbi:C40 family peptidase [Christensenellaceae bacterium OttesenSCG-928-M15]|nr:C40 family peptidase [Christensenellaceae bacterium OttesenSCG-928-M15]
MMAKKSSHKNPRLQFTDEERGNPALEKPIRKVDKAAAKADAAQAKIPKKKKAKIERAFDEGKSKSKVRLRFEEIDKPAPTSNLSHAVKSAPGNTLKSQIHKEIRQSESDNVGIEAAHKLEEAAETGAHLAGTVRRSHQLKPYRKAALAEKRLEKVNIKALYQQALQDNPQLSSNPISRWQQKRTIKKQYAAAKKSGQTVYSTASNTAKGAKKAANTTEKAAQFIYRHKKGIGIVLGIGLMLLFLLNAMSSCSVMFEGGLSAIAASTFPSKDSDMLAAEAAYTAMEDALQYELDNYEVLHSGYDEYHYDLDKIWHDPYVLISILSALNGEFTIDEVQDTLAMLFEKQYILTESVVVETRYRTETDTWTDDEGNSHTDTYEVPYDYYICTVTLENFDLSHVPVYIMGESQLGMYASYMATLGNRPDLFAGHPHASTIEPYTDYDIPPEALEDEVFAAIIAEAEKYLGYPYVWGGSSPATSFDCSGFVSWVINHSGWDVGRLGAQGLYNICTPVSSANVQPGDLVFFVGTYDTPGVSHVGIYVGNGMMIHCGSPISYASINTNYWQSHFYAFGRLP